MTKGDHTATPIFGSTATHIHVALIRHVAAQMMRGTDAENAWRP